MGTTTKLQATAAVAAFLLVSALVLHVSDAAFSTTTANAGNTWSSGSVALSDNDGGGASSMMFNVTDMVPGQTETRCINVTYTGSVDPGAVRVYASVSDTGLAQYLDVTIKEGSADTGTFPTCSDFTPASTIVNNVALSNVATTYADYATGAGTWDPAAGTHSRGYQVVVTFNASAPTSSQGKGATATLTWETTT